MNSPSSIFNFQSAEAHDVGMAKRRRMRRLRALHVDARDDDDQDGKDMPRNAGLQHKDDSDQNDATIVAKDYACDASSDVNRRNTKAAASNVSVGRLEHVELKETCNKEIQFKTKEDKVQVRTGINYRLDRRKSRKAWAKQSSQNEQSRSLEQIDAQIKEIEAKLLSIHNMAATIIQTFFRTQRAIRILDTMKWRLQIRHEAANKIQSAFRLCIAKQSFLITQHSKVRDGAAMLIQSCYRGYIQRMKYHGIISAMTLFQRAADGVRIQKFCRDYSAKLKGCKPQEQNSREPGSESTLEQRIQCDNNTQSIYPRKGVFLATKLQALCRGYATRQFFVDQRVECDTRKANAATVIQAQWRSYSCRSSYTLIKMGIILIQSVVRRWLYEKQNECKVLDMHHNNGHEIELLESVATWCRDVNFEEEMNEMHISFEEEMNELQANLDKGVARLQKQLSQVAAFEFW